MNFIRTAWTVVTTIIFTLVIAVPVIITAIFSKTGRLPFTIALAWTWLILRSNGVRLERVGIEKLDPRQSYVFVSNHASFLDIPVIMMALPHSIRFVTKKSLARVPVFGIAIRLMKMIIIDRSNTASALESLNRSIALLKDGVSPLFFAEGTRSPDGRIQPFKVGAFLFAMQTGLPIAPIAVVNSHRRLAKGSWRIYPGTITIVAATPIPVDAAAPEDRDVLRQQAYDAIAENLEHYAEESQAA